MKNLSHYSPYILRLGLAAVFIWFGLSQILDQSMWVSFIPGWVVSASGLSAATIVVFNGIFEVAMALCLVFGIQVRIAATLLALHMLSIVIDVGLSPIGIRDIGILVGTVAVALNGNDMFALIPSHRPDQSSPL